jgi:tetratricopeptide (TPR) repeat protein
MRLRIRFYTLPLLCSGVLLLACSGPVKQSDHALAASSGTADDSYVRGRTLHLAHRYAEAITAYEAALQADPGHMNARNGLAVVYAEQRDFTRAIALWRGLTDGATFSSGAGRAYLFANLGYAHMLKGDFDAARVALEKACLLDPLNGRAWQYLGETLVQLGQDERGNQMLRQAEALRTHDFRADYAVAEGGARLPAIEQAVRTAVQANPHADEAWAATEVKRNDNGVFELRRVPAARPVAAAAPGPRPLPLPGPMPPEAVALLEISNGNGRQGLARQISRQLDDPALKVVRLTNQKGFGVRQTRIEYQPAFRAVAERLALRVGASHPVEIGLAGRADVRLVIGRDLRQGVAAPGSGLLAQASPVASP